MRAKAGLISVTVNSVSRPYGRSLRYVHATGFEGAQEKANRGGTFKV